jgi:hypothetical protein
MTQSDNGRAEDFLSKRNPKKMKRSLFMNKVLGFVIVLTLVSTASVNAVPTDMKYNESVIQKIRIVDTDLPEGFTYGQIPGFAKKVLLGNPWQMDRHAINKLTKELYPNGNAACVKNMHVSIMTKKEKPFGYDLVCYIIIYNDMQSAKKELEKLSSFNRFNSDRTILLTHGNLAVFLIAQDINNYKYIDVMKDKVEERINSL